MAYQKKCYRSTSSKTNRHQKRTPPEGASTVRKSNIKNYPQASPEDMKKLQESFDNYKRRFGVLPPR